MSEPLRAHAERPICVCRFTRNGVVYDQCGAKTSGPDEPFCQHCQDSGHPEAENQDPIIKRRSNP